MLGISRPTVSRMLIIGKERGIVRIEIWNPDILPMERWSANLGTAFSVLCPCGFFAEGGTRGIPRGKDNPQCGPSVFATRPHPYGHRDSLDGARDADIYCAENLIRL